MKNSRAPFFIFLILLVFFPELSHAEKKKSAKENKKTNALKTSKINPPTTKLEKISKPVEEAVTKTAETTVHEVKTIAIEAHSMGGKFLQAIINVMTSVSPGKTRVYLPALSSDPNSGFTGGALPVFLFVDEKEQIRHILAPMLTQNRIFGINATMHYYWYPKPGAQMKAIASYAKETNRRFVFFYEDPHLLAEWFYFKLEFRAMQEGENRFFGFGPDAPFQNQSNYTLRDKHLQIFTGINFTERIRFTLTHRFRFANVVDGPIDSLPKISSFAPHPSGVDDPKRIFAQRFALSYDSRDLPVAPVSGYFFNLFGEISGPMGGDGDFERVGGDLRGFFPHRDNRFVTGWRLQAEGETGTNTPFYEQSLLGGKNSLRGFGDARFVDRSRIFFALEERIRFYTLHAFNVNVDFEVTPFYETGTVSHTPSKFRTADLHHVFGVGFRSVVRPNVVGIVDLGFGEEGGVIFVGIDYPF